jgi:hypothetical protein
VSKQNFVDCMSAHTSPSVIRDVSGQSAIILFFPNSSCDISKASKFWRLPICTKKSGYHA